MNTYIVLIMIASNFSRAYGFQATPTMMRSFLKLQPEQFFVGRSFTKSSSNKRKQLSRLFSNGSQGEGNLSLSFSIESPEEMEDFGGLLSRNTGAGDVILLDGDLGAGKTCFSRGFIRARIERPRMRVTSPTFLLSNTYLAPESSSSGNMIEIHHMDVYRLSGSEDLEPLDLPRVFSECIALIEWPSQLGSLKVPKDRLELLFEIDEETETRHARVTSFGQRWNDRLSLLKNDGVLNQFLTNPVES